MSQERRIISVLLRGSVTDAIATGNNAAWHCPCDAKPLLIGRTGDIKGPSEKTKVQCPSCKRMYFVVPNGKSQGSAKEVRELVS
jgi:hypothetical protein